jgi:hypothetical protein
MIRLELGTATGAQNGSIQCREIWEKELSSQWLATCRFADPPLDLSEKVHPKTGGKSALERRRLDHFKAILRQTSTLSC